MRHPNQASLALHAGGDLGAFARWRMERHLAQCALCREEVAAFRSMRVSMTELDGLPELPWSAMAAEMRANIRLGLSAGECVQTGRKLSLYSGWRPLVAAAAGIAVLAIGFYLERPRPHTDWEAGAALQATADGVGSQSMRLMYRGAKGVQLSASAGGSVQAHYTDPTTSYMTVSEVDEQ